MTAPTATLKVEGLRELERDLALLGKATARNVLRRVMKRAGEPVAIRAASLAPFDRGHLALGIAYSTRKPHDYDDGKRAFREALQAGLGRDAAVGALRAARRANPGSFVEAFVGPGRHPQAIFQEFGTVNHPPQPFMRPAWSQTSQAALDSMTRDLRAEIDKAAQRLARKAARQAARAAQ